MINIPIIVENSCDFIDRDVYICPRDTCIFVSQSGETTDTLVALRLARKKRALCIGITNIGGSSSGSI
jgi:glucosamine--fructose-6-phosphate aminotransferase (isomerizing)